MKHGYGNRHEHALTHGHGHRHGHGNGCGHGRGYGYGYRRKFVDIGYRVGPISGYADLGISEKRAPISTKFSPISN